MTRTISKKHGHRYRKYPEEKPFLTPKKERVYSGSHLFCIKCNKELDNQGEMFGVNHNFPWGGVLIETSGHYGSTFVDSGFGEDCIRFYICDDCLKDAVERDVAHRFDMKQATDT